MYSSFTIYDRKNDSKYTHLIRDRHDSSEVQLFSVLLTEDFLTFWVPRSAVEGPNVAQCTTSRETLVSLELLRDAVQTGSSHFVLDTGVDVAHSHYVGGGGRLHVHHCSTVIVLLVGKHAQSVSFEWFAQDVFAPVCSDVVE
jgi:hypothetical protein